MKYLDIKEKDLGIKFQSFDSWQLKILLLLWHRLQCLQLASALVFSIVIIFFVFFYNIDGHSADRVCARPQYIPTSPISLCVIFSHVPFSYPLKPGAFYRSQLTHCPALSCRRRLVYATSQTMWLQGECVNSIVSVSEVRIKLCGCCSAGKGMRNKAIKGSYKSTTM